MSRLLDKLGEYSDDLTIGELKNHLMSARDKAKLEEEREINKVKTDFNGTYLKTFEDGIFGKTLEVIHIEEITNQTKNTDWEFCYYVRGEVIRFNSREVFFKVFDEHKVFDTFTEKQLRNMLVITKEEYDTYIKTYDRIRGELIELVKCEK